MPNVALRTGAKAGMLLGSGQNTQNGSILVDTESTARPWDWYSRLQHTDKLPWVTIINNAHLVVTLGPIARQLETLTSSVNVHGYFLKFFNQ